MKICNKCGAQNVDNASFCGTCGNVFPKDEQIVNQPQNDGYSNQPTGSYEQPQNDGYSNQPTGSYEQPQNDGYSNQPEGSYEQPQSGVYNNQPADSYEQPQSGVYNNQPADSYDQPQSGVYNNQSTDSYEQPQNGVYNQNPAGSYSQPQGNPYDNMQNGGFEQPQNGGFGTQMNGAESGMNQYTQAPKKTNKALIITLAIVISVLVIAVCVIVGIVVTQTVGKKDRAQKAVHSAKTAEDQVIFDYEDLKITAELGDFDSQTYSVPVEIENNTGKDLTITTVDNGGSIYEEVDDGDTVSSIMYLNTEKGKDEIEISLWICDENFDISVETTPIKFTDLKKTPKAKECEVDEDSSQGAEYLSKDVDIPDEDDDKKDDTASTNSESQQPSESQKPSENSQTSEQNTQQTAPSTTAVNSQTDWKSMNVVIDGRELTLPFDYSKISDIFTINLADYGYENGYVLNSGDKTYGTIDLDSTLYDCTFQVGFENTGASQCDILNSQIWSFECDIDRYDCTTYPNIVLPGGITWGATADQITAAYGTDPADLESTYGNLDTDGYIVYNYYNDYKYKMRLHVDKEKGLCEIRYEVY